MLESMLKIRRRDRDNLRIFIHVSCDGYMNCICDTDVTVLSEGHKVFSFRNDKTYQDYPVYPTFSRALIEYSCLYL